MPRRLAAIAVAAMLVTGACGGSDDDEPEDAGASGTTTTTATATTGGSDTSAATTAPAAATAPSTTAPSTTAAPATAATTAPAGPPRVRVVPVPGFSRPVALAARAGDTAVYVAEKTGLVKALRGGGEIASVLDLSREISTGSEQGLLGLAFSPDGNRLYTSFTNRAGDSRVWEYAMSGDRPDAGTRREVLAVEQPFSNHNGGNVAFGPDGFLYLGLGDGGSAGDPQGNAQRLDTLLGKLLRIDPTPSGGQPYSIPPGNPFAGRAGARPEIWAYGLRNPWRFSFDKEAGRLWIGDVGQNAVEEVDAAPEGSRGGENYGWNRLEGSRPFSGSPPADHVAPVHEYGRAGGNCSVTGGYVYRGSRIANLAGAYVFSDYCAGDLRALVPGGRVLRAVSLGAEVPQVASFGQDSAGELYALSLQSGLFRLEQG